MELALKEWFELNEMVRAASPAESSEWLIKFLTSASQSQGEKTGPWLRRNSTFWLQPDNFNRLLSQILLNKINVFNIDQKSVRKNIRELMVTALQKDVGFGSRRNMDYARSIDKNPEVFLHPAYGPESQELKRKKGWQARYGKHSDEHKDNISFSSSKIHIIKYKDKIQKTRVEIQQLELELQQGPDDRNSWWDEILILNKIKILKNKIKTFEDKIKGHEANLHSINDLPKDNNLQNATPTQQSKTTSFSNTEIKTKPPIQFKKGRNNLALISVKHKLKELEQELEQENDPRRRASLKLDIKTYKNKIKELS